MAVKQIVVIQNGFVLMGSVTQTDDGYTIEDASVIRKWGTTRGLGEIALSGPTKETVLDPCGVVEVERHAVLMRINCMK